MAIGTIGVIGVGSMGRPMAENLIKAGYAVSVCDIRGGATRVPCERPIKM